MDAGPRDTIARAQPVGLSAATVSASPDDRTGSSLLTGRAAAMNIRYPQRYMQQPLSRCQHVPANRFMLKKHMNRLRFTADHNSRLLDSCIKIVVEVRVRTMVNQVI